jgi:cell pole-organizing protein PopZ
MPYALQQQTDAANPSAADIAAQVRAQVQQQLQDAGVSAQKAKAEADRAAQGTKKGLEQATRVKNGSHVVIQVPDAPAIPLAPLAPIVTTPVRVDIPPDSPLDIPPRIEHLGYAFLLMLAVIAVGKPLARALGALIERRAIAPGMPAEFGPRLERIEQGIESVSIEVERISEAQRYLLKVQSPMSDRLEIPRSAS